MATFSNFTNRLPDPNWGISEAGDGHATSFTEGPGFASVKFTANQRKFLDTLLDPEVKIMFVSGPAGSSKTYMSLYGCLRLMSEDADKDLL